MFGLGAQLKKNRRFSCLQHWNGSYNIVLNPLLNVCVFPANPPPRELVTPPLDKGIILPGVTRRSVLELAESWGDFDVSERPFCMGELVSAQRDGRLMEVFGSGTAAVVTPVGAIHYQGRVVDIPVPTSGTGISHRRVAQSRTRSIENLD